MLVQNNNNSKKAKLAALRNMQLLPKPKPQPKSKPKAKPKTKTSPCSLTALLRCFCALSLSRSLLWRQESDGRSKAHLQGERLLRWRYLTRKMQLISVYVLVCVKLLLLFFFLLMLPPLLVAKYTMPYCATAMTRLQN